MAETVGFVAIVLVLWAAIRWERKLARRGRNSLDFIQLPLGVDLTKVRTKRPSVVAKREVDFVELPEILEVRVGKRR